MEILNLRLTNFRNFSKLFLAFDRKLTAIVGFNGAGKSNILEAVGMLGAVRPGRVETDLDLVKFDREEAKIEGEVRSGSEKSKLTINFQVVDETFLKKTYFINEIKKRWVDFGDCFSVVSFVPADLDLVVGSPSLRRHHLDVLLSGLDRDYWRAISAYHKVITRRNKILVRILERQSKPTELDFWDERLLEHGAFVSKRRLEFFEFLNFVEPSFAKASEGKPTVLAATQKWMSDLSWGLKQSILSAEKLAKNRERDIAAGVTLSGPHRDDFVFLHKGRNLEYFGSRGQQRMAVLALKLSELEYFAVKRQARPILALDDIFSELDEEHREAVLDVVFKQQTIITAADKQSLPEQIYQKAKIIEI